MRFKGSGFAVDKSRKFALRRTSACVTRESRSTQPVDELSMHKLAPAGLAVAVEICVVVSSSVASATAIKVFALGYLLPNRQQVPRSSSSSCASAADQTLQDQMQTAAARPEAVFDPGQS